MGIPCRFFFYLFLWIVPSAFPLLSGWPHWTSFIVSSFVWTVVLCLGSFLPAPWSIKQWHSKFATLSPLSCGSQPCIAYCPVSDKLFHMFCPAFLLIVEGQVQPHLFHHDQKWKFPYCIFTEINFQKANWGLRTMHLKCSLYVCASWKMLKRKEYPF